MSKFSRNDSQWLRNGCPKNFKLLKYEHITYSFEARNLESETLEFKLHSFRASRRYLAHKNPTHIQHMVEEQHQFFNSVHVIFLNVL